VADYLRKAAADLWEALEKKAVRGRTVTVKLRTGEFQTATRRLTPDAPPSSAEELSAIAVELLQRFTFGENARYRLAGVGVSNFLDEDDEQPIQSAALF